MAGADNGRNWENPSVTPYYTGLQIQTSSTNVPIAIIYGANKVAPNCIWTGGFYGYWGAPEPGTPGTFGGKTVVVSGNNVQSWQYYTSWIMALGEGPVASWGTIWLGNQAANGYGADIWAWYHGNPGQTPWTYLAADFGGPNGGQALYYPETSYICSFNYYLGSTAALPQYSIEVDGRFFNSSGINGGDADPAQIVEDFLTNASYGVGFPPESIDATTLFSPASGADSSYQGYCRAGYLALSPALTNQETASSILTRWLKLTNTAAVWSGGKLRFIPYGDEVLGPTANQFFTSGVTFTPNLTPVYSLTDDDFIHDDNEDPVLEDRLDPYELPNWQRIQINWRINSLLPLSVNEKWVLWQDENSYEPWPIDVWDQNAIELYKLRMGSDINANEICDQQVGQIAAQLILQRGLYVRRFFKFKLSFEYCLLDPMDLVEITDARLGLNNYMVRITEIEENDDGILEITAEDFVPGNGTASAYQNQAPGGVSISQNPVPSRVNPPIIFEPPAALTGGVAKICMGVSGGLANVYKLTETPTTSQHFTSQVYAGGSLTLPPNDEGGTVLNLTTSVYVQAAERTAVRLNIFNGSAQVGADFDLSASPPLAYPDSNVAATLSQVAEGSSWYQLTVTVGLAATGTPAVYLYLETGGGGSFSNNYAGTSGDGVYVWGQEFGWTLLNVANPTSEPMTFLPPFSTVSGAAIAVNNTVATPEGTAAIADPNWGGANVYLSTDGVTYSFVGAALGPSRMGALTATLGNSGGNPDTTDTLSVSLVESGGALASVSAIDAQNGASLCYLADPASPEYLSYEFATLTGTSAYNLTTLYRGLEGTPAASHASGVPFVKVDNTIFSYPLPSNYIGVTLYVKLQSFNSFQSMTEDLSECTVYEYVPTGAGSPLGPVTQALKLGQNLDFGLVTQAVTESDQWGLASDHTIAAAIDLGAGI